MPKPPTILLVDDDPAARAMLLMWLGAEGYRVRTASNGVEALKILEHEVPSAMVVDLEMPVMGGAELRKQQQRMPAVAGVPFILVSATHNADRIARELGISDIVPKPFDADRLLRVLASHCLRRS